MACGRRWCLHRLPTNSSWPVAVAALSSWPVAVALLLVSVVQSDSEDSNKDCTVAGVEGADAADESEAPSSENISTSSTPNSTGRGRLLPPTDRLLED